MRWLSPVFTGMDKRCAGVLEAVPVANVAAGKKGDQ